MKNTRRIILSVCAAVLFGAVVFSLFFVVGEADHDCQGDDCPVCEAVCSALVTVALIVPAAAATFCGRSFRSGTEVPAAGSCRSSTPVSNKDVILA